MCIFPFLCLKVHTFSIFIHLSNYIIKKGIHIYPNAGTIGARTGRGGIFS